MFYFFLLLVLDCTVSALLTVFLLHSAHRNRRNRIRRSFFYLLPVIAAVTMVVFSVLFTIPRILDAERLALGGLTAQTVTVERVTGWNSVRIDGRRLTYAPWEDTPVEGGAYRVTIAPRSRMILRIEPVGNTTK